MSIKIASDIQEKIIHDYIEGVSLVRLACDYQQRISTIHHIVYSTSGVKDRRKERIAQIKESLEKLPKYEYQRSGKMRSKKNAKIVDLLKEFRFLTLQEVADAIGLTRERVRQIWAREFPDENFTLPPIVIAKEYPATYCNHCGKLTARHSIFCSSECLKKAHNEWQRVKSKTLICAFCKQEFYPLSTQLKNKKVFCSHKCANIYNNKVAKFKRLIAEEFANA